MDWRAWTPDRPSRRHWLERHVRPVDGAGDAEAAAVPAMLRRRMAETPRQVLAATYAMASAAEAEYVFCSRHGDYQRTMRLLSQVIDEAPLSPADFGLSVHNALAAAVSIATGNKAGHSALAAGTDSFCFGIMEALTRLARQPEGRVILAFHDEPLPDIYEPLLPDPEGPMIAVFELATAPDDGTVEVLSAEPCAGSPETFGSAAQASDFLDFLIGDAAEGWSRGRRLCWHWRRHAKDA